jgi:hypothetical protein
MIGGYVELRITGTAGDVEEVTVDGREFGLEEGGDWSRDRDDGELRAGFLFIAFRDGFDLIVNIGIHGNVVTHYTLALRENDLEEYDIKSITITSDELDIEGLFPGEDRTLDY